MKYPYVHGQTSLSTEIFNLFNPGKYALVETGTNTGCAIQVALLYSFAEIHSIEIEEDFYNQAEVNFKSNENVFLYLGDSKDIIGKLCIQIKKPCLFWLDAHMELDSPIIEEIQSIIERDNNEDVIAIDDIRIVNQKVAWGKTVTLNQILSMLSAYNIKYYNSVNDIKDILVASKKDIL